LFYNNSLRQHGSLSIWFDPDMEWVPLPSGKRGRRQHFSDAAIQTCLAIARQGIAKQCPERG
jgi:Transposase DDE domain